MAQKLALIGAGGKMGVRSASNLAKTDFNVAHVEVSEAGRARLKAAVGVDCVDINTALAGADVVLLAVPDTAIKAVAAQIIDKVPSGAMVVCLDAAGPFAGICQSATMSLILSLTPATRRFSTTNPRLKAAKTTLAASRRNKALSTR